MSGPLTIAAVSAVTKYLLQESLTAYGVSNVVNNVKVSAVSPDRVPADASGINIFFLRAEANPGWAHEELPSRDERGDRVANPYLALDLHYVISAHASTDFLTEILLGYTMQILHENPVLPRKLIRDALSSTSLVTADTPASLMSAIAAAGLADQIEQIKITPYYQSLEDLAHVWAALQTHYRPSCVYRISVVLIESKRAARSTLPVKGFGVYVLPFHRPYISDIMAEDGPGTPIVTGKKVVLLGTELRGDDTRVKLAGVEVSGAGLTVQPERILVTLPAVARAGVQAVQVVQYVAMGNPELGIPETPHRGFESNVAAFVLQPRITLTGGNPDIVDVPAAGDEPRRLRIGLDPLVDPKQRVAVLLNELNPPADRGARAFTIDGETRDPTSPPAGQIDFPIPGIPGDTYLVRVRVDGAESPLDFVSPQGYVGPTVTFA